VLEALEDEPLADRLGRSVAAHYDKRSDALQNTYLYLMGKQSSNDMESQFLSAATDNAKELILGRIRSNPITNSVITTMMILGFDTTTIIKFLHDPDMDKVFAHFAAKKGNLEFSRLTMSAISDGNVISTDSQVYKSLAAILRVSENIDGLRGVRSLNESFKVEQFALDKILETVEPTKLYNAVIKDNLFAIPREEGEILSPALFIFLHPQSRSLFRNTYEFETTVLGQLFRSINVKKRLGDQVSTYEKATRTSDAYKSFDNLIANTEIEKFLIDKKLFGNIINSKNTLEQVELSSVEGRRIFVEGFKEYYTSEIQKIRTLSGKDNAFFHAVGYARPYGVDFPVLSVPKLHVAHVDPTDIGIITEGLRDLRIAEKDAITGLPLNEELAKVKLDFYNNIALYAFIVSGGKPTKGTMLALFDDINITFGAFLNTLPDSFYNDIKLESRGGRDLLKKKFPTKKRLEEIQAKRDKAEAQGMEVNEEQYEEGYDPMYEIEEEGAAASYDEMHSEGYGYHTYEEVADLSKEVWEEEAATAATVDRIYTVPAPEMAKELFVGPSTYETDAIAYRLFPISREILPITSVGFNQSIVGIDDTLYKDIRSLGYSIGFPTTYGGEGSRVLGYKGRPAIEGSNIVAEEYLIYNKSKDIMEVVPGAVIMKSDTNILLKANIIAPLTTFNQKVMDKHNSTLDTIIEALPEKEGRAAVLSSGQTTTLDEIERLEEKKAKLTTAIKDSYTELSDITNTKNIDNTYVNVGSDIDVRKSAEKVIDILNNKKKGEKLTIYMLQTANDTPIEGYRSLLTSPLITADLEIEAKQDLNTSILSVTFTKKSDASRVYFNGKVSIIKVDVDPTTGVKSFNATDNKTVGRDVRLKAILDGTVDVPHAFKKNIKEGDAKFDLIGFNMKAENPSVFRINTAVDGTVDVQRVNITGGKAMIGDVNVHSVSKEVMDSYVESLKIEQNKMC